MLTVAELNTKLSADTRELERGLKQAEADLKGFSVSAEKVGRNWVKNVSLPLALGGAVAIKAGSDLVESLNKADVAFKQDSAQVKQWSKDLDSSYGLTQRGALDAVSAFKLVTKNSDITTKQLEDLTVRVADVGSVFNASADQVAQAVQSALVGEFEPLRRFGVLLDESKIKAEAYASGIATQGAELTAAQKQQAVYNIIMKETSLTQGDAANTADTAAGQMRVLKAEVGRAAESLGQALLPAFTGVAGAAADLAGMLASMPQPLLEVAAGIGATVAVTGVAVLGFAKMTKAVAEARVALAAFQATAFGSALAGLAPAAGVAAVGLAGLAPFMIDFFANATDDEKAAKLFNDALLQTGPASDEAVKKIVAEKLATEELTEALDDAGVSREQYAQIVYNSMRGTTGAAQAEADFVNNLTRGIEAGTVSSDTYGVLTGVLGDLKFTYQENQAEVYAQLAAQAALTDQTEQATATQEDYNKALQEAEQATVDLKDAQFALKDAGFALEDAQTAAAEAQQELNDLIASGGVDMEKVARATDDLTRANENLADSNERLTDAQEDYNEAVQQATERHLKDLARATEDVTKAQQKLAEQQQDVVDAEAKLSKLKAQKDARDNAIKNAKAQLKAADTVTERIIAQDALNEALGMEVVTDEELVAAQADVGVQQDEVKTATEGVERAHRELNAVRRQDVMQSDSVKTAAERLEVAQKNVRAATDGVAASQRALNQAQQPAPGYAQAVEAAQRDVERANWAVEKATWAAEKAQRAYNDALNAARDKTITVTTIRNEIVNASVKLSTELLGISGIAQPGAGPIVPLQMRPTLVMHDGGMVPGPRGAEVPAILEAGERVIPAGGGGGGLVININAGSVIHERDLPRIIADAVRDGRLYGTN